MTFSAGESWQASGGASTRKGNRADNKEQGCRGPGGRVGASLNPQIPAAATPIRRHA